MRKIYDNISCYNNGYRINTIKIFYLYEFVYNTLLKNTK